MLRKVAGQRDRADGLAVTQSRDVRLADQIREDRAQAGAQRGPQHLDTGEHPESHGAFGRARRSIVQDADHAACRVHADRPPARGSGSSRSSIVAAAASVCAATNAGRSRSATTFAFMTSTGPDPSSAAALATPPPVPSRSASTAYCTASSPAGDRHFTHRGAHQVAAVKDVDDRPTRAGAGDSV